MAQYWRRAIVWLWLTVIALSLCVAACRSRGSLCADMQLAGASWRSTAGWRLASQLAGAPTTVYSWLFGNGLFCT